MASKSNNNNNIKKDSKVRWQTKLVEEYGDDLDKELLKARKMGMMSEEHFDELVQKAHFNKIMSNVETVEDEFDPNFPKQKWRKRFYRIAKDEFLQRFIILLIILNSIMMGIGTFNFVKNDDNVSGVFDVFDQVLLYIFTVELVINMIAYDMKFFRDPWLVFDLMTVIPSYIFPDVKIIRAFRIFRAFRLFGRIDSLKRILVAIFSTGPQMASIGVVLLLNFYIFAVMFTQLYGDCYEAGCYCEVKDWQTCPDDEKGIDYFGRLDFSLFTLFVMMTMDNWSTVVRQTQRKYEWAWGPLILFIMLSSFVMLNLVVAVLCDSLQALEAAKQENEDDKIIETFKNEKEAGAFDADDVFAHIEQRHNLESGGTKSMSEMFYDSKLLNESLTFLQEMTTELDNEMKIELSKLAHKLVNLNDTVALLDDIVVPLNQYSNTMELQGGSSFETINEEETGETDEELSTGWSY